MDTLSTVQSCTTVQSTRFGLALGLTQGQGPAQLCLGTGLARSAAHPVLDSAWLGFNLRLEVGSGLRLQAGLEAQPD